MDLEKEKLLKKIDERFSAFGDRIANFEFIKEPFLKTQNELKNLINDFHDFKDFVEEQIKIIQKDKSLTEKTINYIESKADKSLSEFPFVYKKTEEINKELNEIKQKYYSLKDLFTENSEKTNLINKKTDSLFEKAKNTDFVLEKTINKIEANESEIRSIKEKNENLTNKLNQKEEAIFKEIQNLKNLSKNIDFLELKVNDKIENLTNTLENKIFDFCENFSKKLKEIKIPDVTNFITKNELENFSHTVDLLNVDTKNCSLKTNNNEMQLQILNKKVEALQIALKSIELGNFK